MVDLYKYENELYDKGLNFIGGVDEVGRGPLIGSVVAACVVLPRDFVLEGLTDSKKLSEKKRDEFYKVIEEKAIAIGIGIVDEKKIDEEKLSLTVKNAISVLNERDRKIILLSYGFVDGCVSFTVLPSCE